MYLYAVHGKPGTIRHIADAMSAAYMGDGHGIGVGGHREKFVVALLVEHPANRSCSGVSEGLRLSLSSCSIGPIQLRWWSTRFAGTPFCW